MDSCFLTYGRVFVGLMELPLLGSGTGDTYESQKIDWWEFPLAAGWMGVPNVSLRAPCWREGGKYQQFFNVCLPVRFSLLGFLTVRIVYEPVSGLFPPPLFGWDNLIPFLFRNIIIIISSKRIAIAVFPFDFLLFFHVFVSFYVDCLKCKYYVFIFLVYFWRLFSLTIPCAWGMGDDGLKGVHFLRPEEQCRPSPPLRLLPRS